MSGTFTQLWEVLSREGLEAIDAEGRPFDPAVHEAVSGGIGDDLVVATELRRGYTLRGRVRGWPEAKSKPRVDSKPLLVLIKLLTTSGYDTGMGTSVLLVPTGAERGPASGWVVRINKDADG